MLRKGWRCFTITRQPNGYRFRRACRDTPVEIVPGDVEFADQRRIRLPDGSLAVAFADSLKFIPRAEDQ